MNISGFQKLTLLDFPEKTAATIFTGGCNMRCPFCHNSLLVTEFDGSSEFSEEEVLSYLKKRAGILDGICITGGEPLLQKDIADFIKKVRELGVAIKLDTNGSFPEKLRTLLDEGLIDYIAMDIKNSKEKYAETVGIANFDIAPIEESIRIIMTSGVDYEFRTTVVRELHEVADIEGVAEWIKGAKRYFLQNFVDSGSLIGDNLSAHNRETLEKMRDVASKTVNYVQLRGV